MGERLDKFLESGVSKIEGRKSLLTAISNSSSAKVIQSVSGGGGFAMTPVFRESPTPK